ncbi:MAG TPA: acyltransferase [Cyclobacteriaceae bacterium]|nr:acyltransferase [Cyclobacteriaceae bacterium]
MEHSRPYLTTLTPLRGIAALIVVIFHSNLMLMSFLPPFEPHFITGAGGLWVDFFFVLSGFIISYVYGDSFRDTFTTAGYIKYVKARFARVYPLHFVTMIWCLACSLILIHYSSGFHPFFYEIVNPWSAVTSTLLIHSLGIHGMTPLNTPSWSLSTEWWMYMLFPFIFPLFSRSRVVGKIVILAFIAGLFVFIKYYLSTRAGGQPTIGVTSDFGFFRCMAGFLLGMLLFELYDKDVAKKFFRQSWVFIVLFGATIIAMHVGASDLLVVSIFPLIILSAAYNTTAVKHVLDTFVLQRLGDWSFSIYMVHVPIIFVFWIFQMKSDPGMWAVFPPLQPGATVPVALMVCCVVVILTLIVASLTYRYIEVPARAMLNRKTAPTQSSHLSPRTS